MYEPGTLREVIHLGYHNNSYLSRMDMKVSLLSSTFPTCFNLFFPSFCFRSSFIFLVISPPYCRAWEYVTIYHHYTTGHGNISPPYYWAWQYITDHHTTGHGNTSPPYYRAWETILQYITDHHTAGHGNVVEGHYTGR